MNTIKTYLKKAAKALVLVIHDPEVDRTGKQFAAKIAVRGVLALGGSVEIANLIGKLLG